MPPTAASSMNFGIGQRSGIVTGAASGIGRATALLLATMGARVCLVDLDRPALAEVRAAVDGIGPTPPLTVVADAADAPQIRRAVDETATQFGGIDFLVNCAGILRRTAFADMSLEEWDLMLNVNLRGPFVFCRAVVPHMRRQGGGAIVNVASLAGRSSSILGGAHYTAAKHGVIGLSRHLARELGPDGIRVNAFCPGATLTPMVTNSTSAEEIDRVAAVIPRRRWATPEEQAGVIAFLISDASANITGACIDSNGGSLMV